MRPPESSEGRNYCAPHLVSTSHARGIARARAGAGAAGAIGPRDALASPRVRGTSCASRGSSASSQVRAPRREPVVVMVTSPGVPLGRPPAAPNARCGFPRSNAAGAGSPRRAARVRARADAVVCAALLPPFLISLAAGVLVTGRPLEPHWPVKAVCVRKGRHGRSTRPVSVGGGGFEPPGTPDPPWSWLVVKEWDGS